MSQTPITAVSSLGLQQYQAYGGAVPHHWWLGKPVPPKTPKYNTNCQGLRSTRDFTAATAKTAEQTNTSPPT